MTEYNLLTNTDLFTRLKGGDYAAYSEIYQRYGGILFVFIQKRFADKTDAENILIEVFVDLWDNREMIEITGLISTYFYVSLRTKMLNFLERNAMQNHYINFIENFNDKDIVITDDWLEQNNSHLH
ncbi:MAG: hypothetical protein P0Y49_13645 [Candidatus Pedobacter colombiensis]|uniref:RNA polymerase sigma-70 region 2 domain-containing protein n=1 Tax=Candidatus Pedobacter colombiensis TaxID=3121371 RepID=A0AAJ5W4J3_9SPHI|nr:hypothetical protein [Pedobacter sp.]WEK17842.1 MAG: hypothetical protein P0Y49_13645 [Pedobacter sp.]